MPDKAAQTFRLPGGQGELTLPDSQPSFHQPPTHTVPSFAGSGMMLILHRSISGTKLALDGSSPSRSMNSPCSALSFALPLEYIEDQIAGTCAASPVELDVVEKVGLFHGGEDLAENVQLELAPPPLPGDRLLRTGSDGGGRWPWNSRRGIPQPRWSG